MREIILAKIESIEKCLMRIKEKIEREDFNMEDYDTQDIIVLNLQRACQQSIDLAMFVNAELGLGMPKDSVDSFQKLVDNNIISEKNFKNMKGMVGFRNVAIHQYQKIDYRIVEFVIKNRLDDFYEFNRELIKII